MNRRYVGDITYVPVAGGTNLYLATMIDLCSRKLAASAMPDHMRTEPVEDAAQGLLARTRQPRSVGVPLGSQTGYTSKAYARLCRELRATQSMG